MVQDLRGNTPPIRKIFVINTVPSILVLITAIDTWLSYVLMDGLWYAANVGANYHLSKHGDFVVTCMTRPSAAYLSV